MGFEFKNNTMKPRTVPPQTEANYLHSYYIFQ